MVRETQLTKIFVSYSANLKRFISRIVHSEDIDDIIQETFVRSYEADLKKEIRYARSYMLKTAKNLALNHVAKWDNKFNNSIEDFSDPLVELTTPSFETVFETKERFLLFCKATEQLSNSVRTSFILKKVYGLSQKEIAQRLQLSESTVEKHVAKGLLSCAQYMERFENTNVKTTNSVSPISGFRSKVSL
ncbi:MAG: RNA polymerase sigma factor [Alteromonadaceae bacterium]|nr:RNA polymerase sigma factor [Alteromonadaceae bacterium]